MVLYTFHLFSGAGGGILADILLEHRPIGAVEIDAYARQVLLCRQADGYIPKFPIWDDILTFRSDNPNTAGYIKRLCGIRDKLCISGGFPCQDVSAAGKGAGITGEKSGLWREFARVVGEIRPRYVFLENSNLLVRRGLDVVLSDVAEMGYSLAWGIISAADVGAPHIRKRFWAVGSTHTHTHTTNSDADSAREQRSSNRKDNEQTQFRPDELRGGLSDAGNDRIVERVRELQEHIENATLDGRGKTFDESRERRETESRLGGMANGISDWLDDCRNGTLWTPDEKGLARIAVDIPNRAARLKAIGNAQVPLCAATAFVTLKEILERYDC